MRKLFTFASLLALLTVVSGPKAYSQIELYGGYSHLQLSNAPAGLGTSSNGWQGGAYMHLLGPWGFEADYSNHYGVSPGLYYYVPEFTQLYGPRFTLALPRIHPFVHALFGTVHGEAGQPPILAPCTPTGCPSTPNLSENAFGMALGGGLNVKATRHIWLRLVQVDYVRAQFTNNTQNDTRISAGLVFRFGQW